MSLWAPYAQEVPMDLTKNRIEHQEKNMDAVITVPAVYPYAFQHALEPQIRVDISRTHSPQREFYADERISSAQMSPESVSSNVQWSPQSSAGLRGVVSPQPQDVNDFEPLDDDLEYQEFERDALRAMAEKNGGTLLGNNPRMRRAVQTKEVADDSYRKQRERNNFAAKQSRDRRKLREVRLALQVTFLKKKMAEMQSCLANRVCGQCRHHLLTYAPI